MCEVVDVDAKLLFCILSDNSEGTLDQIDLLFLAYCCFSNNCIFPTSIDLTFVLLLLLLLLFFVLLLL